MHDHHVHGSVKPTIVGSVMLTVVASLLAWGAAQSAPVLPSAFDGLDARVTYVGEDRDGLDVIAALPGDTFLEVDLHRDGTWHEVSAERRSVLPAVLVERLLPASITSHGSVATLRDVTEVERYAWGFEVEGFGMDGRIVELSFTVDGQLLERSAEGWDDDGWDDERWSDDGRHAPGERRDSGGRMGSGS